MARDDPFAFPNLFGEFAGLPPAARAELTRLLDAAGWDREVIRASDDEDVPEHVRRILEDYVTREGPGSVITIERPRPTRVGLKLAGAVALGALIGLLIVQLV